MNNFPVIKDGKEYWVARNMAVACFVFAPINGEWCVLANQRGTGTPDFQGLWNCPCGYLDFDETTKKVTNLKVLEEAEAELAKARLALCVATKHAIANCLKIMTITVPEKM